MDELTGKNDQESAEMQYKKGVCCEDNGCFGEAANHYKESAEQGYAEAQFRLGYCYFYGIGVCQNFFTAMEWFTKAANQGHADAQYFLGLCYRREKDIEKSIYWHTKAAEQGHKEAQCELGDSYYYLTSNKEEMLIKAEKWLLENAIKWLSKAANQGHVKAAEILEEIRNKENKK